MTALLLLIALWLPAFAESDEIWQQERDAYAEDNFNTIMQSNELPARRLGKSRQAAPAQAGAAAVATSPASIAPTIVPAPEVPEVELELKDYAALRDELKALGEEEGRRTAPLVVLGASRYTGQAIDGALELALELQVTLGGLDRWKTVPLVGEETVVVAARVNGRPVPLSRRNGYHVWVTQQTGEITVDLDLLVPSRGRRGSLEYDFLVARTPVTGFACDFDSPDLEPRLRSAIQAEISSDAARTHLQASLAPTSRIHLVGYRDQGADDQRSASVYAESLHLLSVDEGAIDLFTVVRYKILYAGSRSFPILVPPGFQVISAEGAGAFRYTVQETEGGTLIAGETAFPIRNAYEISLRLRRAVERGDENLDLTLPRSQGVAREYGWLGVEVTGRLKLEELERSDALAIDVRQLPWELVQNAVSPILEAYRFHSPDARVRLSGVRLPEKESGPGSVDTVQATTVVATEGRVLTDMQITLRNRFRPTLGVRPPEGMTVRSALLDGEPVKPSAGSDGALLLPLRRSSGDEAFTLQLVLESEIPRLGLLAHQSLTLPSIDLPVSSLRWTVQLPARNDYTALESDVEPQHLSGAGSWHTQSVSTTSSGNADLGGALLGGLPLGGAQVGGQALTAGDAGALPVRITLPKQGKRLTWSRYWLSESAPVTVSVWSARSWLKGPLLLALAGLVLLCAVGAGFAERRRLLIAAALGLTAAVGVLAGTGGVIIVGLLTCAVVVLQHRAPTRLRDHLIAWWKRPPEGGKEWDGRNPLSRLLLVGGIGGLLMLIALMALVLFGRLGAALPG